MQVQASPQTIVYFDNRYVELRDANISILTHALHYGTGVFEGIRGYWNPDQHELFIVRPLEHFERWRRNCGILRIELPMTPAELTDVALQLVTRNKFTTNIYFRPIAFKCAQRIGIHPDDQDAIAILPMGFGDYLPGDKGLHAGVSSWRRIEDNAIPGRAKICGAYVNSALATDDARRCGYDEAIFLTEDGHVAEGASCNIFMVRNGRLVTPASSQNVLEGITRDCIMELARRELGLEVVERAIDRSELYICDELFFTGTAAEIAPIVRVDHRAVGSGGIGEIAARLRRLYVDATRGRLAQYRKWLVPAYHPVAAGRAA